MNDYQVIAYRQEGFWVLKIPALDLMTRARRPDEAEQIARSVIALHLGISRDAFDVTITQRTHNLGLSIDVSNVAEALERLNSADQPGDREDTLSGPARIAADRIENNRVHPERASITFEELEGEAGC